MGRTGRTLVASFDAIVMGIAAYVETDGRFVVAPAQLILWGSALAAAVCAAVVFMQGSAIVAWAAIGYILFGALLSGVPQWPLVALAAALMPLVPRPRGSIFAGLAIAISVALATRLAIDAL
ncbi:MAG TPA: hypothetical protein VM052_01870 [Candidatus Limnocylindrales bacterium]|nr:hypothetical protein [Candidatus Limnocylindrales bacterium]